MLQHLNGRVIAEETDPSTLFRGNTLASKAMDHVSREREREERRADVYD